MHVLFLFFKLIKIIKELYQLSAEMMNERQKVPREFKRNTVNGMTENVENVKVKVILHSLTNTFLLDAKTVLSVKATITCTRVKPVSFMCGVCNYA